MANARSGRLSLRRLSGLELIVAIGVLYVSSPFVDKLSAGGLIESILMTVVLVSAVLAISERRAIAVTAALIALPTLGGRWIYHYWPDLCPPEVFLIGGIIFVGFVIVNLVRFVLAAASVTTEVLCASVSAYLLLGLLWTFGYWLVAELVPNAFSFNTAATGPATMAGFNSLYFSFITLSTVGYGDITPVANVARMLAGMEAVTGLLYVAILIARLVSLQVSAKPHDR